MVSGSVISHAGFFARVGSHCLRFIDLTISMPHPCVQLRLSAEMRVALRDHCTR